MISWIDLRERSPMNIGRLVDHANKFNSLVGVKISLNNLNRSKKSLIDARGELELMFTTLQQIIYDRDILKNSTDNVLYGWLIDNLGRYQKELNDKEDELLIRYDDALVARVGISRISSYAKSLKIAHQLIYESMLKSIEEYDKIIESKEIKKEPRTFLYILFHVLQITMSSVGGLARQGSNGVKRGQVGNYPTTWQSLISNNGQQKIANNHNKEHPDDPITAPEVPDILLEGDDSFKDENQDDDSEVDVLFSEETKEEQDGYN